jgi:Phosphate starvation-inducible protein PhoH, predicted ATPase
MARRKSRTAKDRDLAFYSEMSINNGSAVKEGPKKKTFHLHDLKDVRPMNETQRQFFLSYIEGNHVIGNGSAGTGKSFISLYLALNDVLDNEKEQDKIIIVRSAVPSREIGHLPGDMKEKMAVYEEPYKDIIGNLMRRASAYDDMKDAGKIEFMPTSFVRGLTWDNCVVVIDEAQNMTLPEIHSVITRVGKNTKVVICGDIGQNDLVVRKSDVSGFLEVLKIAARMPEFDIINFTEHDIVRSAFVKSWIIAKQSV